MSTVPETPNPDAQPDPLPTPAPAPLPEPPPVPQPEPLPTPVRAAETVRGLGGLYRRARARDASLGTLQAAAVRRLAIHFGLSPDSGVDDVAGPVAAVTGQTVHEVRALLGGGVEDTDEDLAAKAAAVQNLVRYVTGQPGNDEGNVQ